MNRAPDPHAAIKTLLALWGKWVVRSASGALGYPTTSPMFNDMPKGDGYGPQVPAGVSFGGTLDLVRLNYDIDRLPTVQRVALVEVYQRGGSVREVALRMGVQRPALMGWLDKAHATLSIAIDNSKTGYHNPQLLDRMPHRLTR